MLLTPTETERLLIFSAAELARKRRARGRRLNQPEAIALICDEILEGARDGRSVADLIGFGATILNSDDVMPGVADMMPMIQVEGMFPDGTKLVTVHDPIRPGKEQLSEADQVRPGEIIPAADPWVHFGDGSDGMEMTLEGGEYRFSGQIGDDEHRTLEGLCETITIRMEDGI